jgi:3-dehydroquinate synthase
MTEAISTIRVQLKERSYDIEIGSGNLDAAGAFIANRADVTHALVITDTHLEHSHAAVVADRVRNQGARVDLVALPPGEHTKSIAFADQLWQKLLEVGSDRKSIVIAVGGGVIGDLAGFIAATFARGLRFFQVPTTLLAQVDSSVGGKVGVNLPLAKNMVGAFWQPNGVLIDTEVLSTLPEREYRAGLAEIVKYGVILDLDFFSFLESNVPAICSREPTVLRHIITRSCRLKADVVETDEREETGIRAVLNYGHTFGHAIETLTGYGEYLHGEAVAMGMMCAAQLAELMGRIDREVTERQKSLLEKLGLPVSIPKLDSNELIHSMQRDKKTEHGKLRFVLPTRLGHVELVGGVDDEQVQEALKRWMF